MPLSEHQLTLIRQSFEVLRHDLAPVSMVFYDELFQRAPQLRVFFRDDLAGQGMKFMSTLAVVVDNLHDPGKLAGRYCELGALHRRLGVRAEMFVPMGEALIATIKDTLGERHTIDIEAAWRIAYDELATAFIDGGSIATE